MQSARLSQIYTWEPYSGMLCSGIVGWNAHKTGVGIWNQRHDCFNQPFPLLCTQLCCYTLGYIHQHIPSYHKLKLLTTTTLLEASKTWTVGWLYLGAIFTAVWILETYIHVHTSSQCYKTFYNFWQKQLNITMHGHKCMATGSQFFFEKWLFWGELCCVALSFCCVVVVLPFSASLEVIVHEPYVRAVAYTLYSWLIIHLAKLLCLRHKTTSNALHVEEACLTQLICGNWVSRYYNNL